ncbi:MAG TPA: efflux RND transporter periplasmic adaptor subunit, partial [Terriglobales bacterium]|nr:efflux RND transporter periplasmic adaptor subunit [Terriglobales bacterium]
MNYRKAFFATAFVAIALAIVLAYFLRQPHAMPSQASRAAMRETSAASPGTASQQTEIAPKLSPVQLSPERLQRIGVKFGEVKRQPVQDEIWVTGNVDLNEERLAYVQTRFPGWIQKVFADATYQYVRKGQPLFTIYSQDLVSTEQEFLLALKNHQTLPKTQSGTASQEADWLLDAARQRLRQWNVPN